MIIYPRLIAALVWIAVTATALATEPSPDSAANTAAVTAEVQTVATEPAAPIFCEYGCEDHREGAEICINKKQHRCGKQGWSPTGMICAAPPPVVK